MNRNERDPVNNERTPATNDLPLRDRYLSLLQRALSRYEMEIETSYTPIHAVHAPASLRPILEAGQKVLRKHSLDLVRVRPPDSRSRGEGRDWPRSAETMVGMSRLANLRDCLMQVFADGVPGDVLEAGSWRGGASIFMRGVMVAYGEAHRQSWVADSFAGLPEAEPGRYPSDRGWAFQGFDELAVSLETVKANFAKYDLLDDSVHFLKGWFEETLPAAPVDRLALLRLDGDMYSSTMQALNALYVKVAAGGFVVIDDYGGIPPCRQATDDFRRREGIEDPIVAIDWTGVYWRKSGGGS